MTASRSRFVILEHDHPFLHWDLLMEAGEQLASWRLLQPLRSGVWIPSESIAPHRRFYLDYEGPVSHNRGSVRRTGHGEFSNFDLQDPKEFLQRHNISDQDPGDKSLLTFFRLYNSSCGTAAVCRHINDAVAEWWFV